MANSYSESNRKEVNVAFRYSDLLVDVLASNGCPAPSKNCPAPSKPQCPNPSLTNPTGVRVAMPWEGLTLLQAQLRQSVNT